MGTKRANKGRKTRKLNKGWIAILLFALLVRKTPVLVDTIVHYEPHYTTTVVVPDNSAAMMASGLQVRFSKEKIWVDGEILTHRDLVGY